MLPMFKGRLKFDERLHVEDALATAPFFRSISAEGRTALVERFNSKSFNEGETIVDAGTMSDSLLLVIRGTCQVVLSGIQILRISDGKYFGETLLLGAEDTWSVTLEAETFCVMGEITRDDFFGALDAFPDDKEKYVGLGVKYRACVPDGTLTHTCELFAGLSHRTLVELDGSLVCRIFFPGEKLLVQGVSGGDLFLLTHGWVNIEIGGHVVNKEGRELRNGLFKRGSTMAARPRDTHFTRHEAGEECLCFGELGLLGLESVRAATVVASTICLVRVLCQPVFMNMVEDKADIVELTPMFEVVKKRYKNRGTVAAIPTQSFRLKEIPIIQELRCGDPFLEYLATHLQERIFIGGQKIVIEGASDDRCMYILDRGQAKVFKGDQHVTTLKPGDVVGEVLLFGLATTRTSTIVAEGTVYTHTLDQNAVVCGLQEFPEERRKVMMLAFRREQQSSAAPANAATEHDKAAKSRATSPTSSPRCDFTSGSEKAKSSEDDDEEWHAMVMRVVMKAVAASDLFKGQAGSLFVSELGKVAVNHVYMPGEYIMEEGAAGNSMFINISGTASVYTGKPGAGFMRIGKLVAGNVSGELAMLGVSQTRSATIEAETFCCMWEINHSCALPIINNSPSLRENFAEIVVRNLQHTVPARIDSLPLFRGFDRKFGMMLSQYCERKAFFCGQTIFREGYPLDGLCVLNLGRGILTRKGNTIKAFGMGSHFNSTIMLGVHKNPFCTLAATQTCHVVIIPRMAYVQACEMYPSHDIHQKLLQHELAEADKFRKMVDRICVRANLWKKAQDENQQCAQPQVEARPDEEYLRRCFEEWLRRWGISKKRRQEQERNKRVIDEWVKQKRANTAAVLERRQADIRGEDGEHRHRRRPATMQESREKCQQRCREFAHVYLNWRCSDLSVAPRAVFTRQRPPTLDAKPRALPPLAVVSPKGEHIAYTADADNMFGGAVL